MKQDRIYQYAVPRNLPQWPSKSLPVALAVGSLHRKQYFQVAANIMECRLCQIQLDQPEFSWLPSTHPKVHSGSFEVSEVLLMISVELGFLCQFWVFNDFTDSTLLFADNLVEFYTRFCNFCPCPRFCLSNVFKLCPSWITLASSCRSRK